MIAIKDGSMGILSYLGFGEADCGFAAVLSGPRSWFL
jgi:hypothetical protein